MRFERIEIGAQTVAELNGGADQLRCAAVHPGFGNRVVCVGGVDGKARLKDPVLHPAHQQFGLRRRPAKASDVAAIVGHARKPHPEDGGNVVFQRIPACHVVSCPDLCVALDARITGTAYGIRAYIAVVFRDGFIGELAHKVGHHGFQLSDRAAFSFITDAGVFIRHGIIFTVVVPDGFTAVGEKIVFEILLPVRSCLRGGEVREQSLSAPPGADGKPVMTGRRRGIQSGIRFDEQIVLFHLRQQRMRQQHSRLDVGRYQNAAPLHGGKPAGRIFEPPSVPRKSAAFQALRGVNCAVAGREVEPVHREAFRFGGVQKAQNAFVAVLRQFRIVHG